MPAKVGTGETEATAEQVKVDLELGGAPPMPEVPLAADANLPIFVGEPTRVTVKLTPKSVSALERASQVGELNRTDTVNRAIQLYDFILDALAGNSDNALIIERNGRQERVILR